MILENRAVSIHAPARGATLGIRQRVQLVGFNSRAREGRDLNGEFFNGCFQCFNSRAREGRDDRRKDWDGLFESFNSRAREGRDEEDDAERSYLIVSIHAPARGATFETTSALIGNVFQFTRPRGARRGRQRPALCGEGFQFTRPRGARPT